MTTAITTRAGKGSELTWNEVDSNFTNLQATADSALPANATALNKVTLTGPATGSTLTIADGKTLTANNSLTLAGTDSTTMTFPSVSASIPGLAVANTFTATQTLTPAANTSALTSTGYSLTGSNAQSLVNLAGTWNTSGTPTAIKLNVTDTASDAASLLADLQVGGVSKYKVSKKAEITLDSDGYESSGYARNHLTVTYGGATKAQLFTEFAAGHPRFVLTSGTATLSLHQNTGSASYNYNLLPGLYGSGSMGLGLTASVASLANAYIQFQANLTGNPFTSARMAYMKMTADNTAYFAVNQYGTVGFTADTTFAAAPDTMLTRAAAATLRQGAADAAAPVAQTTTVQSVVAGTSNTAGANWTLAGSKGTGTGAGGSIVFQVAPAGTTGTAQNALATAVTLDSTGAANFNSATANGQAASIKALTELTTIAASAYTDTTIQMPAGAIVLGVSVRVTTAITCTSTFTVGDSGNTSRFSTAAVSKAANSTDPGTAAGAYYNAAALSVRITPDTTPTDATGRVRVTIHYIQITPPTS